LISKFFETGFYEIRFCETRAGQGFQRHREKNLLWIWLLCWVILMLGGLDKNLFWRQIHWPAASTQGPPAPS